MKLDLILSFIIYLLVLLGKIDIIFAALRDAVPDDFMVGGHMHGFNDKWADGDYLNTAAIEFNALTCSWYMGFNGFGTFGFDRCVDWAKARGMKVHAHSLLYPMTNRQYWEENPSANVEDTVRSFIETAAGTRRGQVDVWDVVNEAFGYAGWSATPIDSEGLITNFREYHEVGNGGGEYIELAFRWARAADPNAVLILLETNAEEIDSRSTSIYNYVVKLLDRGVPIDGMGFQMHVWHDQDKDLESVRTNFQRFADLGLRLFITEMDVSTSEALSPDQLPTGAQQLRQDRIFEEVAELARSVPEMESLFLWDYGDERSWLHPYYGSDGSKTYYFPTPWSGGLNNPMVRKSSYYALEKGLRSGGSTPPSPGVENDVVRIVSKWDFQSGYITRDGDGSGGAGSSVSLTGYSDDRSGWLSLRFALEWDDSRGLYRIRNMWEGTGYLTRLGVYNEVASRWDPTPQVVLQSLDLSWDSQLWFLEAAGDGTFRLINQWDSATGFLMRDSQLSGDTYIPTNSLSLGSRQDTWDSQYWYLDEILPDPSNAPISPTPVPTNRPTPSLLPTTWTGLRCRFGGTSHAGRIGVKSGTGDWEPGTEVQVSELNAEWWTLEWRVDLQWHFEPDAESGLFRLVCRWGESTGYLTRVGEYDEEDDAWYSTERISMHSLQLDWGSQLWDIVSTDEGYYRLVNGWDRSSGYLTRGSVWDGTAWQPSPTLLLASVQEEWHSQQWSFSTP